MQIEKDREMRQKSKQVNVLQTRLLEKIQNERKFHSRLEAAKDGASEVKEQRNVIMDLKQHMIQQDIWSNKLRKEEVKEQENMITEKIEKRKAEVIRGIQQEQQKKLIEEQRLMEKKQKEIERMEQVENQMLQRLQNTQKKESEVFNNLTLAIKMALQSQKDRLV